MVVFLWEIDLSGNGFGGSYFGGTPSKHAGKKIGLNSKASTDIQDNQLLNDLSPAEPLYDIILISLLR